MNNNIKKTIKYQEDLRDSNNLVYVSLNGSIDASGLSEISYSVGYSDEARKSFIANTKEFRKAFSDFQAYVWEETDKFIAELPTSEGSEAPALEASEG